MIKSLLPAVFRRVPEVAALSLCAVFATAAPAPVFDITFAGDAAAASALRASRAEGRATAIESAVAPVFSHDLVAHNGVFGVNVGAGSPAVAFEAKDNLPPTEGSLVMRLSQGNLGSVRAQPWTLLRVGSADAAGQLEITRLRGGGISVRGVDASGKRFYFETAEPRARDSDRNLVLEYTPAEVRLLLDGAVLGAQRWGGAPVWEGQLRFGGAGSSSAGAGSGASGAAGVTGAAVGSDGEPAVLATFSALAGTGHKLAADGAGESALGASQQLAGAQTKWWDEGMPRLGLEALSADRVPEPFTPVSWDSGQAGVWGRDYGFSGSALLGQVTALGHPLLRGGIELEVDAEGKTYSVAFGAPEVVEQGRGRVIFTRTGKGPGVEVKATFTVEYDGMVWIETEHMQTGSVRPSAMRLVVPFRKGAAEYMQYVGAPHRYESQNLARNSAAMALPQPGQELDLGFKTYFWIGNAEAGLQWFAQSDEGWWSLDRKDAIRVERLEDGAANLVLRIQDRTFPGKRYPLQFGFMATPVKPMPEGWRSWTFTAQYGDPDRPDRGNHVIYWPDEWRSMRLDPEPGRASEAKTAATREKVRRDSAAGRKIMPYWTRIHVPVSDGDIVNPDAERMVEAWGTEPDHVRGGSINMRRISMDTGWTDYLVWTFDQWAKRFGRIDGLYLDETQPIPNVRERSNGGYTAADGTRRPTFEFRGSRDYIKRINYLTEQLNDGQPARTMIHNSSTYSLPYMSEYTVFLPGEHMNSGYFRVGNPEILPPEEERAAGYYYCHVLPMDRLIAEGYWRQWGVPIAWLPQLKNQKDIMLSPVAARDLLSRLQQVDTLIWPLFMNQEEARKVRVYREAFGIGDAEVSFIPYWENSQITSSDEGVKVGYYERPGSTLAIVSNLNHAAAAATLSFAGSAPVSVRDATTGETIPLENGKVHLQLPRNDYQALLISYPEAQTKN